MSDRLISYNGQAITYDTIGNPLIYRGNTLTWQNGRQLASYGTYTYTYNADGLRIGKTNGNVTTEYVLNGSQVMRQVSGTWVADYLYHENGIPLGFAYYQENGTPVYYLYETNLQGDIVAIYDANGNKVVSFTYDAWGNFTANISNSTVCTTSFLAASLFRYRSYIYDYESGLYYLQSRYYDPETGRFINADDIDYLGANGDILGYNLFAYCNNNPIKFADSTGCFMELLGSSWSGVAIQIDALAICYIGAVVVSLWDKDVRKDMNRINWNPFNADARVASNCNAVSFYKGVPVITLDLGGIGSGSFGAIIIDNSLHKNDMEVLKHERGHNTQLMTMGLLKYGMFVCIPSPIKNGNYTPWELSASQLGGSKLATGASAQEINDADTYYKRAHSNNPFSWWLNIWTMLTE